MLYVFSLKYGDPHKTGWGPRRRLKHGYYPPEDIYEALVNKFVTAKTVWLDVGGGRALFPHNHSLSQELSEKCKSLTSVDPSENVFENPYAHEKYNCLIEDFDSDKKFDLVSFRMVAEHVENPDAVLNKIKELVTEGGVVIIYTVNKYSPIPILTKITPFSWHYTVKKFFWGGEEKDTFPVQYKMNTKRELNSLFNRYGFSNQFFWYLDDLSAFSQKKLINSIDLLFWRLLKLFGLRYPEVNILCGFKKEGAG